MTILDRAGENRLGRAAIVHRHNRCVGAQAKIATHCVVGRDRTQNKPATVKKQNDGKIELGVWTIEPRGDNLRLSRDRKFDHFGDRCALDLK